MADNPSNLPIEDQFLRWRQDMERKLDDQARQMTDLRLLSERLQQENNRLLEREHARLQERQSGDENPRDDPRGSGNPSPLPIRRKGKEPALQADPDTLADDELSSGNSPLPGHSAVRLTGGASRGPPPIINPRAGTRRNASRHPGRSTSRAHYRPERERGHDPIAQPPTEAPFYLPSAPPTERHTLPPRGHRRMLSSPFGRHIMEYDPPRGFTVPPFVRFDGSSDPYDHMMHYNQAMILSTGNDPLLCKIFPASLKGPALAWFHKLPPYSVNSFDDLWEVFTTQYLCSVRQKGSISSLQTILRREDESIRDFTRRFGQAVQQVESCSMDTILQNFRRSFAPSTPFFQALSLKPPPTMEDLYKKADRYATLEDNTRAATQAVVITNPTTGTEAPALLYLGSSSLSSIDCLYESATCKEQAGGPAVVCRSASPMAKSVLVSENPFVFRVFEVRTFFAEEVPLYILHIRGLSFRLLWEEDHVDCRRGISSLLFRKGNPHFKEGFC